MTLTGKQKGGIAVGAAALLTLVLALKAKAAPVVCEPGYEKCIGLNWCRCNPAGTKWDVITPNATQCAAAPVCTPGDEKCIGLNKCRCKDDGTGWVIVTPNATECLAPPTTAVLYGTVKDASTMGVIDGIVVNCGGYTDTTVADGTYRIVDIPAGTYSVRFSDPSGQYQEKVV